jgi:hypothetical protein
MKRLVFSECDDTPRVCSAAATAVDTGALQVSTDARDLRPAAIAPRSTASAIAAAAAAFTVSVIRSEQPVQLQGLSALAHMATLPCNATRAVGGVHEQFEYALHVNSGCMSSLLS